MIAAESIEDLAKRCGIIPATIKIEDEGFLAPQLDSITVDLADSVKQALTGLGIGYSDAFDCNHFSGLASAIAGLMGAKAGRGLAPAFGTFAYITRDGGGHSINVAVHRTASGGIEFAFYEPQPNQLGNCLRPVTLTKEEIASCLELRLA